MVCITASQLQSMRLHIPSRRIRRASAPNTPSWSRGADRDAGSTESGESASLMDLRDGGEPLIPGGRSDVAASAANGIGRAAGMVLAAML